MPKAIQFYLAFVFLGLAASLSMAQGSPPMQVRFLAQLVPDGVDSIVMVTGELRGDPFKLPTRNLSEPIRPPARAFALRAADEGNQLLARIALPEKGRDFIVLLVIGKQAGYTPIVIDSSDLDYQVGDVYAYNSSSQTIQGQVGSSGFVILSGKSRIIKPEGAVEDRYYNVAFGLRDETDGKVRILSTSRWPVTKVKRSYLFFFDQPQNNSVTYRAVDEYLKGR